MILKKKVFYINGVERMFMCDPENDKLSDVIRRLGLTGCKVGCGIGVCGSCNLIINGKVERSCNKKITAIEDYAEITTIEGIGTPQHLHPLQQAWISYGAVQCGFCVPGFIVSAYALLQQNNNPTREEVRDWFQKTKNVCRCTGYKQIVDAVMAAAKVVRGEWTMEDLTARNPKEGEFLGKPLTRPDGLAAGSSDPAAHCPSREDPRHPYRRSREDAGRCEGHPREGPDRGRRYQHHGRGPVPREKYCP